MKFGSVAFVAALQLLAATVSALPIGSISNDGLVKVDSVVPRAVGVSTWKPDGGDVEPAGISPPTATHWKREASEITDLLEKREDVEPAGITPPQTWKRQDTPLIAVEEPAIADEGVDPAFGFASAKPWKREDAVVPVEETPVDEDVNAAALGSVAKPW